MALTGTAPDPWQAACLRCSDDRLILLASRQSGKTICCAALALNEALLRPRALCLVLSPTERQSGEFMQTVRRLYDLLGRPLGTVKSTELQLRLGNGSRLIGLPGSERTVRCYSGARLLVIDEAARVCDALYFSVRPMLSVSRGRLVALSTPFGKRGWFHEEWSGANRWQRVRVTAEECPRIGADFLAEERLALGERWYRQEYGCSFEDVVGAVFSQDDISAALSDDVRPLFRGG